MLFASIEQICFKKGTHEARQVDISLLGTMYIKWQSVEAEPGKERGLMWLERQKENQEGVKVTEENRNELKFQGVKGYQQYQPLFLP